MQSIKEVKKQQKDKLNELIRWAGTQTRLAHNLGVSPQVVSAWVKRGRISATCAADVDKLTAGLFKKQDLRPDVINWIK